MVQLKDYYLGSLTLKTLTPDISALSSLCLGLYKPAGKSEKPYSLDALATSTYFVAAVFINEPAISAKILPVPEMEVL